MIEEGLSIADYASLYDHPDKYINHDAGGNPGVSNGGEPTRVMLTATSHWKNTNSTTMTFASRIKTLKTDRDVMIKYLVNQNVPLDYRMWLELLQTKTLVTPLPGRATHTDMNSLSPFFINYIKD